MRSAHEKRSSVTRLIASGAFALAVIIPAVALAQQDRRQGASPATATAAGQCQPNIIEYKVSRTAVSTTTTSFVPVIETNMSFVQGGTKASCIIVHFSSEASAVANETMAVQAVVDTSISCLPANNYFVTSNATQTGLADRAMNYVCPSISPGSHTVQMQYRSSGGGTVTLDYRTTLVQFTK